ncbi:hypothetical protein Cp4433_02214 [Clostridium perfringens]|uniref:hypothetical protein n=1 Tax=Clostridium perfringens TaxID=1502 RepID=UPI00244494C2|nr:hypothetical protein [Clostridium perfringens]MDG6887597.1 hypothetical protein [Clostridium perfringens]
MNKKQIYNLDNLMILLILSIFCFPSELRVGLLGRVGLINYMAIIIILSIIVKYTKRIKIQYIVIIFTIQTYYLFSSFFYEKSLSDIILVSTSFIIPLLIIFINVNESEFKKIFYNLLIVLNVITISIVLIGVIEYLFNINIMMYLSKIMSPRIHELLSMRNSNEVYRMYSFMGHPLFNTEIILMFYVLNNIYSKYYKTILNNNLVALISLIGIALTASKTGLILIILSLLFLNYKKFGLKRIILCILIFFIIIKSGIFNNTINRFLEGGLTTGRESMWIRLQEYDWFPIKFFTGYGNNFTFIYNNYMSWASAAFEYPFRKLALEHGVFITLLEYIPILLYPIITLIKRRNVFLLTSYLILFVDVNTYNGLALNGDYMLIFCLFIFIIINMSKVLLCRKDTSKDEDSFSNSQYI